MQLAQIQVARDQLQDRLTLRVATTANEEFRVYFTRRFLRELWPHLTTMLSGHLAAPTQNSATGQAADSEAPTFEKPFREDNPLYPLGATPLLASEATLSATGPGSAQLTLREGRERSFNLALNRDLLQALCAMLRAGAEKSQWDLALDYDKPASTIDSIVPTPAKTSLLH